MSATDKIARLEAIDVGRGLAALGVTVYHLGVGDALAHATNRRGFELLNWPGSALAVPVFFVISGFCIHLGSLGRPIDAAFTRRFLILRFFRIYPPWVFAVLFSALSLWVCTRPPEIRELVLHLTLTNSFVNDYGLNPALWSVSVECLLYLLYPLWLGFRQRHGLAAACLLAAGVSALSNLVTARLVPQPIGPSFWFFLNVWCGWVAGAALAELCHARRNRPLLGTVGWLCGGAAWLLHLLALHLDFYTGAMFYAYLPVKITLCVWPVAALIQLGPALASRAAPLGPLWHALARIGVFSYSLYLIHIPIQWLRFGVNDRLTGSGAKGLLFFLWFFLVLAAAWLCHRWVEAPSARLGRRLAERWTPAPPVPQVA